MPKVIGVRFRTSPRMYYFAPVEGEQYPKGASVVVETQRGVELAIVVMSETEVDDDKIVAPLKSVVRLATQSDLDAARADNEQKQQILATAKQKVYARGLDMKIVDCEFTVDHSKLVLYFTAEQRVDFRELVRDLASAFHMRIDLRQIGARDECKLIGSLGSCGLPCCCGRFESDSDRVSIKMAKNQNLALTPNKINGMCGRLLCCLSYENRTYEDVLRRAPKIGTWVELPDGRRGSVVSVTPLTEKVRVRVGNDDNFEFAEYDLADIKFERKAPDRDQQSGENERPAQGEGKKKDRNKRRDNDGRPCDQNDGNQSEPQDRRSGGKKKKRRNNNRNDRQKPASTGTE